MQVRTQAAAIAIALVGAAAGASAQTFNGPEFAIDTYGTGPQVQTDVAVGSGGHFVVVWAGEVAGDDGVGIAGRVFRSSGVPLGGEFHVNTATVDYQVNPAVAVDANGRFVVVWESYYGDGDQYGVKGQLFAPDGSAIGGEFQVNTYTTGYQYNADVAFNSDGTFVVTWQSDSQDDGYAYAIVARRYDNAGNPLGGEFVVNSYTTGYQYAPSVVAGPSGFRVVWDGQGAGDDSGIFMRQFDLAGNPLAADFRVNSGLSGIQYYSQVAGQDGFVVTWEDYDDVGGDRDIWARRFDSAGNPLAAQFRVNSYVTGLQLRPSVGVDSIGGFLVSWWDADDLDGSGRGVWARQFAANGVAATADFRVNTYTTGYQSFPSVGGGGPGDFVVTWESESTAGYGAFGQRFGDLVFSDNAESGSPIFWTSVQPNVTTTPTAAMAGTDFGFQAQVSGTAGVFLQDDSPENENRYRARFYLDPNAHDPGEASNQRRTRVFVLFEEGPNRRLAAVVLRRLSGQFALSGRVRLDDNSQANTPFVNITDAAHWVELDWQRSSGPDANNGFFTLTIDGTPVSTLPALDNSISSVDMVRLGTISNKTAASGQVFVDEFVSRRANPIGPVN
jgi:hypothetical protein